jgi:hypothetical protein
MKHWVGGCAWSILVVEFDSSHRADFRCARSGSAASQTVPSVILMYLSGCCEDDDHGGNASYCCGVTVVAGCGGCGYILVATICQGFHRCDIERHFQLEIHVNEFFPTHLSKLHHCLLQFLQRSFLPHPQALLHLQQFCSWGASVFCDVTPNSSTKPLTHCDIPLTLTLLSVQITKVPAQLWMTLARRHPDCAA